MPYSDPEKQKQALKESSRKGVEMRQGVVNEWMTGRGCVSCGETDRVVLDLHHRDPSTKVANVGKMVHQRRPVAAILEELEKCVVLCANCHRRYHAGTLHSDVVRWLTS